MDAGKHTQQGVFPEPFLPMMPNRSPSRSSNDTPSNAVISVIDELAWFRLRTESYARLFIDRPGRHRWARPSRHWRLKSMPFQSQYEIRARNLAKTIERNSHGDKREQNRLKPKAFSDVATHERCARRSMNVANGFQLTMN